jgi:hypothetical protein
VVRVRLELRMPWAFPFHHQQDAGNTVIMPEGHGPRAVTLPFPYLREPGIQSQHALDARKRPATPYTPPAGGLDPRPAPPEGGPPPAKCCRSDRGPETGTTDRG